MNKNSMDKSKYYYNSFLLVIQTSRVQTSVISGVLAALIIHNHTKILLIDCILKSIPIIFVTMSGFICNDIYDYEKDKKAGKNRPICSGRLSKKTAAGWAMLFAIFSLLINLAYCDFYPMLVISLTIALVALYSPFSRHIPLFKGFYTAVLCCSPLIYGLSISGYPINVIQFVPIIIFIFGREIMLDIFDLRGDGESNLKTFPNYFGVAFSKNLSWLFVFLGSFVLLGQAFNTQGYLFSFIAFSIIVWAYLLKQKKSNEFYESITRLALLIGSIALTFNT